MMKITINFSFINKIKENIIRKLIIKRAYKGYLYWVYKEHKRGVSFDKFKSFDYWKIVLCFSFYLNYFKKLDFDSNISFNNVFFNK